MITSTELYIQSMVWGICSVITVTVVGHGEAEAPPEDLATRYVTLLICVCSGHTTAGWVAVPYVCGRAAKCPMLGEQQGLGLHGLFEI